MREADKYSSINELAEVIKAFWSWLTLKPAHHLTEGLTQINSNNLNFSSFKPNVRHRWFTKQKTNTQSEIWDYFCIRQQHQSALKQQHENSEKGGQQSKVRTSLEFKKIRVSLAWWHGAFSKKRKLLCGKDWKVVFSDESALMLLLKEVNMYSERSWIIDQSLPHSCFEAISPESHDPLIPIISAMK